ncbi:hypothetical protein XFLM_01825 [Xylella fastidiosa subsp. fastidiosa GB514]|nr:hypothetical protein XFLM_01825 [Xylella fastidiosa subsp. fastidiosa GB514]KAF0571987.1 hypothetical protein P305_02490 [Xylella fastidiosa subsp. fastidiosa Mus-1]
MESLHTCHHQLPSGVTWRHADNETKHGAMQSDTNGLSIGLFESPMRNTQPPISNTSTD